jgi:hypothetical protein
MAGSHGKCQNLVQLLELWTAVTYSRQYNLGQLAFPGEFQTSRRDGNQAHWQDMNVHERQQKRVLRAHRTHLPKTIRTAYDMFRGKL